MDITSGEAENIARANGCQPNNTKSPVYKYLHASDIVALSAASSPRKIYVGTIVTTGATKNIVFKVGIKTTYKSGDVAPVTQRNRIMETATTFTHVDGEITFECWEVELAL